MNDYSHFVGTRAVSDQHRFDIEALSAWLSVHLQGFAGPLSVEMFKGGQSNPTYKLVTPERSYVMRAKPGPVAKLLPCEFEFMICFAECLRSVSLIERIRLIQQSHH